MVQDRPSVQGVAGSMVGLRQLVQEFDFHSITFRHVGNGPALSTSMIESIGDSKP
jgi:hypothetical protein